MDVFLKLIPLVCLSVSLLLAWFCWSLRQLAISEVKKLIDANTAKLEAADAKNATSVGDAHTRLTKVETRVDGLDEKIDDLPTKEDIARLEGEIKGAAAHAEAASCASQRIEGFLIEQALKLRGQPV